MTLDKYSELKIASNVLGFTLQQFAKENDTSVQVIRDVCLGHTTSARLTEAVANKINEADRVYRQHREAKLQAETE